MNAEHFINLLYPDGRAFANVEDSKKYNEVIAIFLNRIMARIEYFQSQIWYINDDFEPELWEARYDITVPDNATFSERRQIVKAHMLWGQTKHRLTLEYLQLQLDNAGYGSVTISRNETGTPIGMLHGNSIDQSENFSPGADSYNSLIISGTIAPEQYENMLILLMGIRPLDTVIYDNITSDLTLAIDDTLSLAIDDTLTLAFNAL